MTDFFSFPKTAGNDPIIDSGTVIVSANELFTIDIHGLSFSITAAHDPKLSAITTDFRTRQHIVIKINTWQGGDLTFKFKVGTIEGGDLYLAVHLDVHYNYHIITYTFTQQRP